MCITNAIWSLHKKRKNEKKEQQKINPNKQIVRVYIVHINNFRKFPFAFEYISTFRLDMVLLSLFHIYILFFFMSVCFSNFIGPATSIRNTVIPLFGGIKHDDNVCVLWFWISKDIFLFYYLFFLFQPLEKKEREHRTSWKHMKCVCA